MDIFMEENIVSKEITFELTDYCPHNCGFCSTDANKEKATFLDIEIIIKMLKDNYFEKINISGGEPLAHPDIYRILTLCNAHLTENGVVVLYSNMIQAIAYNATVLPGGVRVICNLPVLENIDEIHVLKMVEQGRARNGGPRFHNSKNFGNCNNDTCDCNHTVVIPSGKLAKSPCRKDTDLKSMP